MSNMRETLDHLLENLQIENQVIENMLDLARQKREVIISGSIKELDQIMRREVTLLQVLNKAEGERFKGQTCLAESLEVEASELTAAELKRRLGSFADAEYVEAIRGRVDTLAFNLNELKELNTLNNSLLNQSLSFIESMEAIFSRSRDTTYSPNGMTSGQAARPGLLDKRV